jgi:hypothetical protein
LLEKIKLKKIKIKLNMGIIKKDKIEADT